METPSASSSNLWPVPMYFFGRDSDAGWTTHWTDETSPMGVMAITRFGSSGLAILPLIHEGDRHRVRFAVQDAITVGHPYSIDYRLRNVDGHFVWVTECARAKQGEWQGILIESSNTHDAFKELRESIREQAILKDLINRASVVFFVRRKCGEEIVEFVSDTIAQWGYHPETFYRGETRWADLIHPDDRARVRQEMEAHPIVHPDSVWVGTYRVRMGDDYGWVEDRLQMMADQGANGILLQSTIVNVDAKVRMELEREQIKTQLYHSEKLASMGLLTASMIHEMSNPVTIISASLTLLRESSDEKQRQIFMNNIDNATERLAAFLIRLKNVSRHDVEAPTRVNVHLAVQDVVGLLTPMYIPHGIQVTHQLRSAAPFVLGNMGKTQQVIMNLIVNAHDAMMEKKIKGPILVQTADQGDQVVIRVSDTGTGIHPDLLATIFSAFYTTKKPGKGTGLGLSISKSIVTEMKGEIFVDSVLGEGTTFTIVWPRMEEEGA